MTDPFAVPAEPPYTYNDPRIIYNEACFFYNGGYDLICLFGDTTTRRKVGRGKSATSSIVSYPKPQPQMINILFKTCLDYVNDENYEEDEYCEVKEFKFKKEVDINLKLEKMTLKGKRLMLTSEIFSPKVVEKHMSSSTDDIKTRKTKISSSLTNLKLKSYISSSLVLNKPRKIKLNSSIFNKKENKGE